MSDGGKGSKRRQEDREAFERGYDRIHWDAPLTEDTKRRMDEFIFWEFNDENRGKT